MKDLRTSLTNIYNRFKNRKRSKAEKIGGIILAIMLISLIAFAIQDRYSIAVQYDYSVKFVFGIRDNMDRDPHKGKYLSFNFLADKNDLRYGEQFVKLFACVEGDILHNKGRDYYCNNEYIGTALEFSEKGTPLPYFKHNGVIKPGHYFVLGETKNSYDSKYWGFVKKEWITGSVHKII